MYLMFQRWMFILNISKVSDKVSVAYVQVLPVGQKLRLLQTLYSWPCVTPVTVYFLTVIITCSCFYNPVFVRVSQQVVLNGTKNSLCFRQMMS